MPHMSFWMAIFTVSMDLHFHFSIFINFCHFFCQFLSIVSLYARYFASVTQYFSSTLFTKSSVIIKIAFDSQTIYLWSRIISDHIIIRFIPPPPFNSIYSNAAQWTKSTSFCVCVSVLVYWLHCPYLYYYI